MKLDISSKAVRIIDSFKSVIVDRTTHEVIHQFEEENILQSYEFLFPLGIYNLNDELFIVIVEKSTDIYEFRRIKQITQTKITQITNGQADKDLIALLDKGLNLCTIYYSDDKNDNLAVNYQDQLQGKKLRGEFTWNKVPMQFFKNIFKSDYFLRPVIAGFVGFDFPFLIMARRSRNYSGVHYWTRGADRRGHPANFVESEQIYFENNKIIGYVQLRGSIPAHWSQIPPEDPFMPPSLGKREESAKRFDLHFKKFKKHYPNVKVISLTSDKNREKELTLLYHSLMKENNIIYKHLNINHLQQIDHGIYKAVNEEIKDSDLLICENNEIKKIQTIFTRTNCLSCLDRANVFQTNAGEIILTNNGVVLTEDSLMKLKKLWIDHGNALSYQYSLTGAQRTALVLTNKAVNTIEMKDNFLRVMRIVNEVTIEGTATDAYCAVTQDTKIKPIKKIGWIRWFITLIYSLILMLFAFIIYRNRRKALLVFKKFGGETVNHPHYRSTQEAEDEVCD